MKSLVLELQQESYDSNVSISNLLRKALIVAKKLKIKDFENWINSELNGYKKDEIIPDYRSISGSPKTYNPYNGWIPLIMEDKKAAFAISNRSVKESITHLEDLIKDSKKQIIMQYPHEIELSIINSLEYKSQVGLFIDRPQMCAVIEVVRNTVLKWSLELEENGIMGEGMSFSDEEKKTAADKNYNINNFFGNVKNSQIQQDTNNSVQLIEAKKLNIDELQKLIELIESHFRNLEIDKVSEQEIELDIETIKMQLKSSKPKSEIISTCLSSIREIFERVATNIIVSGLIHQISQFL